MPTTTAADHISLLSDRNLDAGRGDTPALITEDGSAVTYAEVHRDMCRFAARLRDAGVHRGERVLLVMDDTPRFHAAFLGSIRAGAVPVPVNFLARPDDFGYFLSDSYAVLAVVDEPFLDAVGPQAEPLGVPVLVGGGTGEETVESWVADGPDHVDPVSTHPEDPAFWLYSSGSTGRPKGVVHAQRDVAATCTTYAEQVLGLAAEDRVFSTTKLFHAYGLGNGLSFPMWVGATAIQMTGRPAPDRALAKIEAHQPTVLFSVPALYNAMLAHPDCATRDLSSLRLGASAAEALPAEIWRRWHDRTGTEILDGIGSTEMLHIYCSNRAGQVVPGTSGFPVPGYELQLRDEHGTVIGSDGEAVGDLYVAGPSRLSYYWHHADKTERCLHGRWFFTGDRYRRGADGAYAYEGRADDMMKVKGLWVSPIEIENRLIEHDAVQEAAVIGVERDGMTAIKAHVILAGGREGDDELTAELQEWCKAALLRYQYPHEVVYVEDFPRTATGKVQRFKLRARD
ncbi:benzoate-CoA ligase family protein [Euzebya sp.]|uniref:benzoate-CoA ligase family protein n=1 Tax=Euzebya sp. TaxID=1971409 RepID=UPI003511C43B